MVLAKQAGIPKCEHLDVELVWAPGDRRRRDEDNIFAFLKVLADGLARGPRKDWVGLQLVPDDTSKYFTKRTRIVSPDECDEVGMWLIVTTHGELAA
jgi:crossover junction endodeoxyribonuclease RusA